MGLVPDLDLNNALNWVDFQHFNAIHHFAHWKKFVFSRTAAKRVDAENRAHIVSQHRDARQVRHPNRSRCDNSYRRLFYFLLDQFNNSTQEQ